MYKVFEASLRSVEREINNWAAKGYKVVGPLVVTTNSWVVVLMEKDKKDDSI